MSYVTPEYICGTFIDGAWFIFLCLFISHMVYPSKDADHFRTLGDFDAPSSTEKCPATHK
jgi:hypothetical protein